MTELEEDDIYDDGLSITNKIAVNSVKSIFESPPTSGPKPKVPVKPGSKFSSNVTQKNDLGLKDSSSMNGSVPALPSKGNILRDGKKNTTPSETIPKRSSKVNIPDIFNKEANDPGKASPRPPPKPVKKDSQNTAPWSQRHLRKDSDSEKNNEQSREDSEKKDVTPKLPNKPNWANRQRQVSDNDETPEVKLTWSQRQALKAEHSSSSSETSSSPKSQGPYKAENSTDHPKKRPSVLDKYHIHEQKLQETVGHPKPVLHNLPRTDEKGQSEEKSETERHSPRRPAQGAFIAGLASASKLESVIGGLKHVTPKKDINSVKTDDSVNLRQKVGDKSTNQRKSIIRKSLTRHIDNQKFYVVEISDIKSSPRPPKPPKIKEKFDLDQIIADYRASIVGIIVDDSSSQQSCGVTEEDEELYEPIPADEDIPLRESAPTARGSSRVVSLIQPMTEDEEFVSQDEYEDCETNKPKPSKHLPPLPDLPDSLPPARPPKLKPQSVSTENLIEEEEYNDCETGSAQIEDAELEQDDVYEPLDELNEAFEKAQENKPVEQEIKKEEKPEEKDDKLSEKERKKKEKEEQKRLKEEKKKQEKEMKELKSKFKVEPFQLVNTQGEGNIRKDAKGGRLDLQVKTGQRVILVRLVNNPAGKWLVKLKEEGKVGYVDSNNVEVDNTIIRNVMEGSYVNMHQLSFGENVAAGAEPFDQEEYADVEQEEYADVDGVGAPVQEDYYEDC